MEEGPGISISVRELLLMWSRVLAEVRLTLGRTLRLRQKPKTVGLENQVGFYLNVK